MRNPSADVDRFLESLARDARSGDRLPPIRDLMKRFGASQVAVQRAFGLLKERGLIKSEVGRGTFFIGGPGAAADTRQARVEAVTREAAAQGTSLLLLRRSISIARGRLLVEGLQKVFVDEGARVLELSYTDPAHARSVLVNLPRFDACVVQSTYRTIPIDLLAELREKSAVLAVDGLALVGSDVEAVGTEWGEPLAAAVALLRGKGHQRIAFATTAHPFLSTQLAMRRFAALAREAGEDLQCHEIAIPCLPDEGYAEALVQRLRESMDASGRLPFSALVTWGIEDGAGLRAMLSQLGVAVPSTLSVVLLGRPDIATEHADFFDMAGSNVSDQVDALHRVIRSRLEAPDSPCGVTITPLRTRAGQSVAQPPKDAARRRQR